MNDELAFYCEQIENTPENVNDIFKDIVESGQLNILSQLLHRYKEEIERESFRFLYPLTIAITDYHSDNYKQYIDAIYEAGLTLDVSKYNETLVCNDILSLLYMKDLHNVVDYLIYEKEYPPVFLNSGNFYDTCCLNKDRDMVEHLYKRGFPLKERHFLYENLMPENLSKTFAIFEIIHKSDPDFNLSRAYEKLFFASKKAAFSVDDYQSILNKHPFRLDEPHLFEWMSIESKLLSAFYKSKELLEFLEVNGFPFKDFIHNTSNSDGRLEHLTDYILSPGHKGITDYFSDNHIQIDLKSNFQIMKMKIFFEHHANGIWDNNQDMIKKMHITGFKLNDMQSSNDLEEQLFNKLIYLKEDIINKLWLIIEKETLQKNLRQAASSKPLTRL